MEIENPKMPVQEKAASIEKNGQETVQELSEKFLVNEETGVIDKIKNVLNPINFSLKNSFLA